MMTGQQTRERLQELANGLQILLLDVDGVLTDGGIILIGGDQEAKRFDVQDGMGITLAKAAGVKVAIITSRESEVVNRRAKELALDEVIQGIKHKTDVLPHLLKKYGIRAEQAAYIGDDIQDVGIMMEVGIPIAVQNARPSVKQCSVYVTEASGGHGAVREAVEWLLEMRGDRERAYNAATS
jgi:3-deoxy-D-manno-octulosonate 8-phosphate phosphatase (KDO 8-P phosphatase)